jgi:hypothetical protein
MDPKTARAIRSKRRNDADNDIDFDGGIESDAES